MAGEGRERLAVAIRAAEELRRNINEIEGLWAFGTEYMGADGMAALDPLKITVQVTGLGLSGFAAEEDLRQRNVACELADARNVLFLLSYADGPRETARILAALWSMAEEHAPMCTSRGAASFLALPPIPEMALAPRDAYFARSAHVDVGAAEGRVAAETIVFYPPGIPVLAPGDVIDGATLAYLRAMKAVGARVVGAADAEGAAEPAEEGVAEASEDGAADAEEEVSEEASGAAEDGAVDEAGSSADVLDSAGSFEGDVVGSAAEIVDGLAGLLTPEARSMLTRSPQSRVFAPILQLRLCPASSSGRGTCQTAWEAEELSPRATRVSRRSAITRRIIS